jgi:hypothetical protein
MLFGLKTFPVNFETRYLRKTGNALGKFLAAIQAAIQAGTQAGTQASEQSCFILAKIKSLT